MGVSQNRFREGTQQSFSKFQVCLGAAGSPGASLQQSAQSTHVMPSQGLFFLGESAEFLSCLEQVTGELGWIERRIWGPGFLGIN